MPADQLDLDSIDDLLARAGSLKRDLEEQRRIRKDEEERRHRKEQEAIETEVLQLDERSRKLEAAIAELKELGANPEQLEPYSTAIDELKEGIRARSAILGYDPIQERQRDNRSKYFHARLMPIIEDATTTAELRKVLNEFEDSLPHIRSHSRGALLQNARLHELAPHIRETLDRLGVEIARLDRQEEQGKHVDDLVEAVRELEQEVSTGVGHVHYLSNEELYNQMCIWAGKARLLQADADLLPDAAQHRLKGIFGRLNDVSKTRQPGYCDALDRNKDLDWNEYVQQYEERLPRIAAKVKAEREARKAADLEAQRSAEEARRRESAARAELHALRSRLAAPAEIDPEEIRERLRSILEDLTASEVAPVMREHAHVVSQGSEFKALRRHLARIGVEVPDPPAPETNMTEEIRNLVETARRQWKGERVALVGGRRRPEVMDQLERLLEPASLRWVESVEGATGFDSLLASIRNHGTDVVVVFTGFVPHRLDTVKGACSMAGIPFLNANDSIGLRAVLLALARIPAR